MNRLQIYILAIAISLLAFIINALGAYTFTTIEIVFFASSILMVFSFNQKLPEKEETVDKPQVYQYRKNRLNIYNYLGAFNIAVVISIYLLLKYIDTPRAAIYLFVTWALSAFVFRYIYLQSSIHLFKANLISYLMDQAETNKILADLKEESLTAFIELLDKNYQMSEQEMVKEVTKKIALTTQQATLLYSLTKDYLTLIADPIQSSELPE